MSKKTKTYASIGKVDYYARRQKNIRLSLRDSQIRVSYPFHLSFKQVEKFLKTKVEWILKNKIEESELKDGLNIGRKHRLEISDDCPKPLIKNGVIRVCRNHDCVKILIKKALKTEAEEYVLPLVDAAIEKTNLKPQKIRIRYMRTQWGSCTSQKNIGLNSALVYLPDELIEYIIIHELCHLKFLNHSDQFWRLVAQNLPYHQDLKKSLKKYRIGLTDKPPA